MLDRYRRLPIAQQIILATITLLLGVFFVMTSFVYRTAEQGAIQEAGRSLEQETRIMVGTLDTFFENVSSRGERQSNFLAQWLGGPLTLGEGSVRTGEVELPVIRVGGETVNGNARLLQSFRDLTGDEAAFLVVHEGKVYRAATLLKKDGKPMFGTELSPSDPVTRSVLKGEHYAGMTVRNGAYNFSTVKVLKTGDGRVYGAYSVRINLENELKQIRELFGKVVSGKTGSVSIIRPTDEKGIGEFVLHPVFQGKSIAEAGLDEGMKNSLREMLTRKNGLQHYQLTDTDGSQRERMTYIGTSPGWGWTLVSGSWLDEYLAASIALRNMLILITVGSALVLSTLVFLLVRRSLSGLSSLVGEVSRFGEGDLRVEVADADHSSRNEVHVLRHAVSVTVSNMRTLVADIASTAERVRTAADQLQEVATATMNSSQQQSNSASSIAASVEEMTVSITQVADHAHEASQASDEAKTSAGQGRQVVGKTVVELERVADDIGQSAQLIDSLGERSKQISNVVNVIREIAEQTNLLALNAAIEAARAGEMGRGFAVVADEVRKLAERTAVSTQEISGTIQAIVGETASAVDRMRSVSRQMASSVDLARTAGEALVVIDERAGRAVQTVQSIAESTREQSAASQEIARLIEGIASMSDENASTAGRNREEASGLQRLSGELQSMLRRFKV